MKRFAQVGTCQDTLDLAFTMGLLPFRVSGPYGSFHQEGWDT